VEPIMVARLWSEIEPSVTIDTYRERLAAKASKADLKRHVTAVHFFVDNFVPGLVMTNQNHNFLRR
jgi:hypothetical protein